MKLNDLAQRINARRLTTGRDLRVGIDQVYAGDLVSDLLNAAADHALLITNLTGAQLARLAELMDVPAICVAGGQTPEPAMVAAAGEHGTVLMVSPANLFETCGRVYAALLQEAATRA